MFPDEQACIRYARYVVARYSAYNVCFGVTGEWQRSHLPLYIKIGNMIARQDPHNRMRAIHDRGFGEDTWTSFGAYQQVCIRGYLSYWINQARHFNKPVVNGEYGYYLRDFDGDGKVDRLNGATAREMRDATYEIAMSGGYFVTGFGSTYWGGHRNLRGFEIDNPLNKPWEEQAQHIRKLFTSLQWWKLEPHHELLRRLPALRGHSVTRHADFYCLAELGQQYVVYLGRPLGAVSLALGTTEKGSYSVRKFDPETGGSVAG